MLQDLSLDDTAFLWIFYAGSSAFTRSPSATKRFDESSFDVGICFI